MIEAYPAATVAKLAIDSCPALICNSMRYPHEAVVRQSWDSTALEGNVQGQGLLWFAMLWFAIDFWSYLWYNSPHADLKSNLQGV